MPLNDESYEKFMAAEKARTAAEQERRRERLTETRDALARFEQYQAEKLAADKLAGVKPRQIFDPWENLLQGLEKRAGVIRVFDANGDIEYRVRTRFLLTSVICVNPERINGSTQGVRLGRLMRSLGWRGPMDLRFGKLKAKGYAKTDTAGQDNLNVGSGVDETSQNRPLSASLHRSSAVRDTRDDFTGDNFTNDR